MCLYFLQVIGAESLQTREPTKTFALLRAHIAAIRSRIPILSGSQCLIVVERNLGFEAEHLHRECSSISNTQFVSESKDISRVGVLTTLPRKQEFVTIVNILLRETRIFAWDRNWVCVSGNKTRNTLYEQMSFFGYTFSTVENQFQREKFAISGKGSGGKDDLCMAFLLGVFVCSKFFVTDFFGIHRRA